MQVPPGYEKNVSDNTICKLKKALYGLRNHLRHGLEDLLRLLHLYDTSKVKGITPYSSNTPQGGVTILLVYVEDIIMTGDDWKEQQILSHCLAKEFEIKTVGKLKYYSGIEVAHYQKGIFISQQKYIIDLLKET